jgi:hypothetical protein
MQLAVGTTSCSCSASRAAAPLALHGNNNPSCQHQHASRGLTHPANQHAEHPAHHPCRVGVYVSAHCAGSTLHTVAVKANPVSKVLQVFKDQGMGAEVRSLLGNTAIATHQQPQLQPQVCGCSYQHAAEIGPAGQLAMPRGPCRVKSRRRLAQQANRHMQSHFALS